MRDPIRIQRILNKLAAAWQHSPDLRLGQLVENVIRPVTHPDMMWGMEDDEIESLLDAWMAARGITVSGGWQS